MSEIRKDLGYNDELPSEESQRAMRRILAGKPPNDPEPDWQHSEETIQAGKEGVAQARESLHSATPPHKIAEQQRAAVINDARTRIEIQRKASTGEPLSPEETEILNRIHLSSNE